jgi:hypothetical protein
MKDLAFKAIVSLANSHVEQKKHHLITMFLNSQRYKFSETSLFVLESEIDLLSETIRCMENEFLNNLDIEAARVNIINDLQRAMTYQIASLKSRSELDPKLRLVYLNIKQKYIRVVAERVNSLIQSSREASYTETANFLCSVLNHVGFILSEIDYLVFCKSQENFDPFITLDYLDLIFTRDIDKTFVVERLKFYKDNGLLRDKFLCVKSYLNAERLESDQTLNDTYELTLEEIKKCGFEIVCIL